MRPEAIDIYILTTLLHLCLNNQLNNTWIRSQISLHNILAPPRPVLILLTNNEELTRAISEIRRSAMSAEIILLHTQIAVPGK